MSKNGKSEKSDGLYWHIGHRLDALFVPEHIAVAVLDKMFSEPDMAARKNDATTKYLPLSIEHLVRRCVQVAIPTIRAENSFAWYLPLLETVAGTNNTDRDLNQGRNNNTDDDEGQHC